MSAAIRETREGGGHMITCQCGWLRWTPGPVDADKARAEHGARCKVAGGGES